MNMIAAFLSTAGFAVLFNIPRKEIAYSSFCGMVGWMAYLATGGNQHSVILSAFTGALVVGAIGEVLARVRKQPATVFVVPGIIPLVPGYGLYYAMLQIIEGQYDHAMSVGTETMLVAVAIASGVIVSSSLGRMMKRLRARRVS